MCFVFQLLVGVAGAILCMCNIDWLLSGDLVDHWGALAMLGVVWLKCMREQAGPVPLVCFYTILICLVWLGILYWFAFLPWAGPEAWRLGLRPSGCWCPSFPLDHLQALLRQQNCACLVVSASGNLLLRLNCFWNGFCDGFCNMLFFMELISLKPVW